MNLQKVKRDLNNLKSEMGKQDKPTLQGFFKWCKVNYYHRDVSCRELMYSEYTLYPHIRVKSNPALFCQLSEKYFKEIHQVKNPVRDGTRGLKWQAAINYNIIMYRHSNRELLNETMDHDKVFNKWFDDAWEQIISDGYFCKYNEIRDYDEDNMEHMKNEFEKLKKAIE